MVCIMLVLLRRRLLIFWPWNLGHCVCVREESEQYLRGVFYSHIMGDVTEHTKNYYYCGSYTELNLNQKCV